MDLLYAQGNHQNNNAKRGHVHPPFVLGLDFAGIVVSVPSVTGPGDGPSTTNAKASQRFKVGDRVMSWDLGAYAEYIAVAPSAVHRIPDRLSGGDAAALVGGVVSYAAVMEVAKVRREQWVLVTGVPGGLGVIAVQVAKVRGAKVIALARTRKRAEVLREILDCEKVLAAEDAGWLDEVKKITGGEGVDAVIDNVGVVEDSLRCIAYGGTIVLVGFAGRGGVMEKVGMNKILLKGANVIGYRFGEATRRGIQGSDEIWKAYLDMLATGAIRPLIDTKGYHGIELVPKALQDLDTGRLWGKAVIEIQEQENAKL